MHHEVHMPALMEGMRSKTERKEGREGGRKGGREMEGRRGREGKGTEKRGGRNLCFSFSDEIFKLILSPNLLSLSFQ